MLIEPLTRWHIQMLKIQGNPGLDDLLEMPTYLPDLIKAGPTFAGIAPEGVVGAMGFIEQNKGNFRCWANTDKWLLPKYLPVVCKLMIRQMNALVAEGRARRIETVVQVGNEPARRWVELLGFKRPHLMRCHNEYGDAWLYERIPNG